MQTFTLVKCPNRHIDRIDEEQLKGNISIEYIECNYHGYINGFEMTGDVDA